MAFAVMLVLILPSLAAVGMAQDNLSSDGTTSTTTTGTTDTTSGDTTVSNTDGTSTADTTNDDGTITWNPGDDPSSSDDPTTNTDPNTGEVTCTDWNQTYNNSDGSYKVVHGTICSDDSSKEIEETFLTNGTVVVWTIEYDADGGSTNRSYWYLDQSQFVTIEVTCHLKHNNTWIGYGVYRLSEVATCSDGSTVTTDETWYKNGTVSVSIVNVSSNGTTVEDSYWNLRESKVASNGTFNDPGYGTLQTGCTEEVNVHMGADGIYLVVTIIRCEDGYVHDDNFQLRDNGTIEYYGTSGQGNRQYSYNIHHYPDSQTTGSLECRYTTTANCHTWKWESWDTTYSYNVLVDPNTDDCQEWDETINTSSGSVIHKKGYNCSNGDYYEFQEEHLANGTILFKEVVLDPTTGERNVTTWWKHGDDTTGSDPDDGSDPTTITCEDTETDEKAEGSTFTTIERTKCTDGSSKTLTRTFYENGTERIEETLMDAQGNIMTTVLYSYPGGIDPGDGNAQIVCEYTNDTITEADGETYFRNIKKCSDGTIVEIDRVKIDGSAGGIGDEDDDDPPLPDNDPTTEGNGETPGSSGGGTGTDDDTTSEDDDTPPSGGTDGSKSYSNCIWCKAGTDTATGGDEDYTDTTRQNVENNYVSPPFEEKLLERLGNDRNADTDPLPDAFDDDDDGDGIPDIIDTFHDGTVLTGPAWDRDNDGVDDDEETGRVRNVEIFTGSTGITIASSNVAQEVASSSRDGNGQTPDDMEFSIDFERGLSLSATTSMATADAPDRPPIDVAIASVFEFRDIDADGLYDPDIDHRVSMLTYTGAGDFIVHDTYTVPTADGGYETLVFAESLDGVVRLTFHVSGTVTMSDVGLLEPERLKFDVVITYPYTANDTLPGIRLDTDMDAELVGQNSIQVERPDSRYAGSLTWKTTAFVDGVETDVRATYRDGALFWTYTRGVVVAHDPSVGVIDLGDGASSDEGGDLSFALIGVMGTVMMAGGAGGYLLSERKKFYDSHHGDPTDLASYGFVKGDPGSIPDRAATGPELEGHHAVDTETTPNDAAKVLDGQHIPEAQVVRHDDLDTNDWE